MYAALSLPQPLMAGHRPHPKNERKKWRTRWYFFLSFGFTVYNSLFNSQCYMKSAAHTGKSCLPILPAEQKEPVFICLQERKIFQKTCLAWYIAHRNIEPMWKSKSYILAHSCQPMSS